MGEGEEGMHHALTKHEPRDEHTAEGSKEGFEFEPSPAEADFGCVRALGCPNYSFPPEILGP